MCSPPSSVSTTQKFDCPNRLGRQRRHPSARTLSAERPRILMCGICGVYWYSNSEPVSEALLGGMLTSIRHRGPDEEGMYYRRRCGARLTSLEHHRSRWRNAADLQRRPQHRRRLQRRDLQLSRTAIRAGAPRAYALHFERHRGDRPSLRGGWRRLRSGAQRHVRVRVVGYAKETVAAGSRSAGDQASVLCRPSWTTCLRLGNQSRAAASGDRGSSQRRGSRTFPLAEVCARASDHVRRHPCAATGHAARVRSTRFEGPLVLAPALRAARPRVLDPRRRTKTSSRRSCASR